MLNRVIIMLVAFIMNACVYETGEDEMGKLGWSQSGTLLTGSPNKAVNMQVQLQESGVYTVQFNIDPPPVTVGLGFKCQALITWTVNGNAVQRQVSLADGVGISGTGENVQVTIRDASFRIAPAPLPQVEYIVSVQVAKGVRANTERPVFDNQELATSVAAGGTGVFPVPQESGITSFYVFYSGSTTTTAADVITVNQLRNNVGAANSRLNDIIGMWVPLVPGVDRIEINNIGAGAEDTSFRVLWGVEG